MAEQHFLRFNPEPLELGKSTAAQGKASRSEAEQCTAEQCTAEHGNAMQSKAKPLEFSAIATFFGV